MLLRRQILYTVKPTRKPHYCGGEYSRNPRDEREKENKTLKSKPPFRELNQDTSLLLLAGSCTKARQRKGKKGDKVPREIQAATREQLGSIPVDVRGKRSGNHIQWKVEVPELGRLWDMRYLWPGLEILKWRNIGF